MILNLTDTIKQFVLSLGAFAPFLACLLILVESILPFLPLCAFITINFICFGNIIGFIISWIFTCLGCFFSYYLFFKGFKKYDVNDIKKSGLFNKCLAYIKNLSLPSLTVILAIPFTPAFMMNIAAGVSHMKFKKFARAILISKIFMVYFWGYVGVGLIESFKSPVVLVKVAVMVILAFIISKVVNKNFNDNDNI